MVSFAASVRSTFLINLLASRYEGYYAKLYLAIRELGMDGWILDITMSLFEYLSINPTGLFKDLRPYSRPSRSVLEHFMSSIVPAIFNVP